MEYHTGIDLDVTLAVGHMIRDTVRHSDGATPPAGKIAQMSGPTAFRCGRKDDTYEKRR